MEFSPDQWHPFLAIPTPLDFYSRKNIAGVANKLAGGEAGVEVPETQGLVPRRREGELAVRRDHDVRHKVVVAVENLLGEAKRRLVAGELPDNDRLV